MWAACVLESQQDDKLEHHLLVTVCTPVRFCVAVAPASTGAAVGEALGQRVPSPFSQGLYSTAGL